MPDINNNCGELIEPAEMITSLFAKIFSFLFLILTSIPFAF